MQRIRQIWQSGIGGKIVLGCGGLIGVLFACALCSVIVTTISPKKTATTAGAAPTSVVGNAAATTEVAPTPTVPSASTDVPAPTVVPTPAAASLDTPVESDRWRVVITDVNLAPALTLKGQALTPKGRWLVVRGQAHNKQAKEDRLSLRDFVLQTSSGAIRGDGDATGAAGLQVGLAHTIAGVAGIAVPSNGDLDIIVAYDVPRDLSHATIHAAGLDVDVPIGDDVALLPTSVPTATPLPPTITPTPPPTNTPAPTNTALPPTETPIPPTPTAAPEPIALKGHGQKVTDKFTPPGALTTIHLTHDGDSNFAVFAYDAAGKKTLLVNEIGHYSGTHLLDGSDAPLFLEVQADGNWTVEIKPLAVSSQPLDSFDGQGDMVSDVFQPSASGAVPYTFTHTGESNFAVYLVCAGGRDLLQNEIGAVNNEAVVTFGEPPCLWEVQADGKWTIHPK